MVTKAIEHPDSLADLDAEDVECEDIITAHYTAYEELTGNELEVPDGVGEESAEVVYKKGTWDFAADEGGWDFDDDAEMSKRYPKLSAKFG